MLDSEAAELLSGHIVVHGDTKAISARRLLNILIETEVEHAAVQSISLGNRAGPWKAKGIVKPSRSLGRRNDVERDRRTCTSCVLYWRPDGTSAAIHYELEDGADPAATGLRVKEPDHNRRLDPYFMPARECCAEGLPYPHHDQHADTAGVPVRQRPAALGHNGRVWRQSDPSLGNHRNAK